MPRSEYINVRVDSETKAKLKAAAEAENRTVTNYVENLIKKNLEGKKMKATVYVLTEESGNEIYTTAYAWNLDDLKSDYLSRRSHLTERELNNTRFAVFGYETEYTNAAGAKEAYEKFVDEELEERGYIGDAEFSFDPEKLHTRMFSSNIIIFNEFGQMSSVLDDFFIADTSIYDDADDAIQDYLEEFTEQVGDFFGLTKQQVEIALCVWIGVIKNHIERQF